VKKKFVRYSVDDLTGMSLASLEEVAARHNLKIRRNDNRAKRVEKILGAYAAEDASAVKSKRARQSPSVKRADTSSVITSVDDSASPPLGVRKPAFERHASAVGYAGGVGSDSVDDPLPHGGKRPGAGRPMDMTDEVSLYNRLPQQPHPVVEDALELLFKAWSTRAKCPDIVLLKEQAFELALPYTQMLELLGLTEYIPAWFMVGITCVWTTWNLVSAKAEIARAAMAAMAERKSAESVEPATV